MSPLLLDQHRSLFKDDAAFNQFVKILEIGLGQDLSPIILNEEVIGTVLSPEATKEVLYERMIQRLSHAPATLDEIRDRLENDEIVD